MKLEFVKAGEIVTTHGVKGEVKVLPWLDSPEDLCDFERCRISGKEYMIPAVSQFILDTNMEENTMQVKLIEGMRSDEN